jgi:hypothetical protein
VSLGRAEAATTRRPQKIFCRNIGASIVRKVASVKQALELSAGLRRIAKYVLFEYGAVLSDPRILTFVANLFCFTH